MNAHTRNYVARTVDVPSMDELMQLKNTLDRAKGGDGRSGEDSSGRSPREEQNTIHNWRFSTHRPRVARLISGLTSGVEDALLARATAGNR